MLAARDWTTVTAVGAFVVGVAFGVLLTIRVARVVVEFIKGQQHRPPPDDKVD